MGYTSDREYNQGIYIGHNGIADQGFWHQIHPDYLIEDKGDNTRREFRNTGSQAIPHLS